MSLATPLGGRAGDVAVGGRLELVDWLFLISAFLAPIELLLVSSFSVYDAITLLLFAVLFAVRRLQAPPRFVIAAGAFFLVFALLSTMRAPYPKESLTQVLQFAFIFFVQIPVVLTLAKSRRVMLWAAALFCAGALFTLLTAMLHQQVINAGRMRLFFSDNPNRLGYPVAYVLPFVLCLVLSLGRRHRIVAGIAVFVPALYLMLWALTGSASRSSLV